MPNAFVQISSIMPQKRNPVPIEHLRHLASQTLGRARTVLDVIHNTPFTDMNDSEGETPGAWATRRSTAAGRVLDLLAALRRRDQHRSGAGGREHPPLLHHHHRARRLAGRASKACPSARRTRSRPRSPRRWSPPAASLPKDGYEPFLEAFRHSTGREPSFEPRKIRGDRLARAFRRRARPLRRSGARADGRGARASIATRQPRWMRRPSKTAEHEATAASELGEKFKALVEAR